MILHHKRTIQILVAMQKEKVKGVNSPESTSPNTGPLRALLDLFLAWNNNETVSNKHQHKHHDLKKGETKEKKRADLSKSRCS